MRTAGTPVATLVQVYWLFAFCFGSTHLGTMRKTRQKNIVKKKILKLSHLGVFEAGQVKAHMHHELGATAISRIVSKPRVKKSHKKRFYCRQAIADCMSKLAVDPDWTGQRKPGSGALRRTTPEQDEELLDTLLDSRGQRKVTVHYLRTELPWARELGDTALEERLYSAGLAYLRRRRKTLVLPAERPPRIAYCKWVMKQPQSFLDQWCWADGIVIFLDRTEAENQETQRAAVGTHVWRMADGSDALHDDCVGPSQYKKSQGVPIRVWGLLANGKLHIHVLDQGEVLDRHAYQEIVEDYFDKWKGPCSYLVQDFEPAIRTPEALLAIKDIGLTVLELYPKRSQDFNAIENIWKLLREELTETLPLGVEKREAFLVRLNAAVESVNTNRRAEVLFFSRNQKQRCKECLEAVPPGSRTRW